MIRIILVVIFILIIFILSLIAWPIEYVIGRFNPRARDLSSLK
jgi:1-acyl-sn-glycerol-3-phosphate acyltransferase